MAIITTKNYFLGGNQSGQTWSSPASLIDGIKNDKNNGTLVRKGGQYYAQHIDYYYKFSIPQNTAADLKFTLYPEKDGFFTINIELYYGTSENNKNQIGSTWTKQMTKELTPNWSDQGGNPMLIDFKLNSSDQYTNIIENHRDELMLRLYVTGSQTGTINELEIWVPDSSKIYIDNQQASALYVGNQKASAVYLGTTKIL